jgi:predicted metalloprotease with PDZ domain
MRFLIMIVALPLLLSVSQAEQNWPNTVGVSSEDSGSSAYLGVDIADVTSDRLGALKLKEERGAEVTMVDQDAPAGKAGVKEHDVILSVNGTPVEGRTQLQRMIHETPPGRVITLGLSRDGQPLTIKVQLADRRSEMHMYKDFGKDFGKDFHVEIPPIPPIPPMPEMDIPSIGVVYTHSSMRSGLMVENLTPQLGEFFGAKNGNGVLVRSVDKGSRGEKAGLHAGDVITKVGEQFIHDTSDFTHALRSHSGGSVNIVVIRDKKEQTLSLTLPERKESGDMLEESFDSSDENADNQLELSELQEELAEVQPQLAFDLKDTGKATAELQAAVCAQKRAMRKAAEKIKKEYGPEMHEELEQKLRQEFEQLRQQFDKSFDI